MTQHVATIQSGEPLVLQLLRTNDATGAGEPLPSGWTLSVALKAAPYRKAPPKEDPVAATLTVENGTNEDWLVTLSAEQSEALANGFYALDGRIKNAMGETVIITEPVLIVVEGAITPQ